MYRDNPPAFPVHATYEDETVLNEGMELRDYFAAKAMQGMLAACTGWSDAYQEHMARTSYRMADEMLKAREA